MYVEKIRALLVFGAWASVGLSLGCSKSAPEQFPVSGWVLFDGKPAPAGKITFEPNAQKGNQGPTGFALIKNGQFDTREAGQGSVAGRIVIRITVGDGVNPSEQLPYGRILLKECLNHRIMPRKAETMEIDIPKMTP